MASSPSSSLDQQLDVAKTSFEHLRFQVTELEKRSGYLVTATAFFLTATAALLNNADVRNFTYVFDDGTRQGAHVQLGLSLLMMSLLFGTFSVLHSVLTIGPQVRHYQHVGLPRPSFLSFLSIGERPRSEWEDVVAITDPVALKIYMRDMYTREAGELAKEAQYRYGRLGEVRAFLFLAVASLAMSLVIVLDALSHHYANGSAAQWSQPTAVGTGLVLLALTFVAGHDRVRIEADNWTPAVGRGTTVWLLRINVRSLSMFAGLAVCAINGSGWFFSAALLCLAPSFWALKVRRSVAGSTFRVMDRVSGPVLSIAALSLIMLYAIPEARPFLFAAALAPLIIFEGIRLIDLLELLLTLGGRLNLVGHAAGSLASRAVGPIRRVNRSTLRRKSKARNQP